MHAPPAITFRGALCALAATAIWGGNFIISRAMAGEVPPITLACLRWACAALFMLPFCWKDCLREWPAIKTHWRYYLFAALTGVSLFNTLFYVAGKSTDAINMALIATASPVFTLLLSRIFLGEALTPARIIGLLTAVAGVVLLAVRGDLDALLHLKFQTGDLITLAGAFVFALYTFQVRYKPAGTSPSVFMTILFIAGLIALLPFMAWELAGGAAVRFSPVAWFSVLYLGLGASIGGFWFWNKAIASIGPANASLLYYTLPFFSGVAAVILLAERVRWVHWASGFLIISGILIATRLQAKRPGG